MFDLFDLDETEWLVDELRRKTSGFATIRGDCGETFTCYVGEGVISVHKFGTAYDIEFISESHEGMLIRCIFGNSFAKNFLVKGIEAPKIMKIAFDKEIEKYSPSKCINEWTDIVREQTKNSYKSSQNGLFGEKFITLSRKGDEIFEIQESNGFYDCRFILNKRNEKPIIAILSYFIKNNMSDKVSFRFFCGEPTIFQRCLIVGSGGKYERA